MKKALVIVLLVLTPFLLVRADVYIKSNMHTDPVSMMGQTTPAQDVVTEQWMNDDMLAMHMGDRSSIIDFKNGKMFMVNHGDKTYIETALPLDMAKLLPPELAQMMGGMMKMTVSVQPNGQTRQVGQWKCSGYDVAITMMMMPMKMTVWATPEVAFDFKKYMEKGYANLLKAQMMLDESALQEMMKVNGFWILTETTVEMMGAKSSSRTEVLEIAKKTPPAGAYAVPEGYKKTDRLSMQDLQRR